MEEITKSLLFALLLIVIIFAFGVVAYHNLEGWGWVDCIYFMSSTVTTVGYGDIVPTTDEAKLFTVFFMWTGISIGFYLIYTISKYREEKIDHRLLPFIAHVMGGKKGKATSKRGPYSPGEFDEMPMDLRQMINPARPSERRKTKQVGRLPPPIHHKVHKPKRKYKK